MKPGSKFPKLNVFNLDGHTIDISVPLGEADWKMIVVYRGKHCPLCTKYLNLLENYYEPLSDIGIELVAVSADNLNQVNNHLKDLSVSFPIFYGLTIKQMHALDLFISYPRSEHETDHPFPEPATFVINEENNLQVVDVSNNPFSRPDLESLVSGLKYIRENDYPIRGTYP